MTSAEQAYLFRHAVLRDAAYAVQLPSDRATLHLLAARIMIDLQQLGADSPGSGQLAEDIVRHLLVEAPPAQADWVLQQRRHYTELAAAHAAAQYRGFDAVRLWRDLASICEPDRRASALYRGGCTARELSVGSDVATGLLREALAVAQGQHDALSGQIGATLGFVLRLAGHLDDGKRLLEQALTDSRASHDRAGEALALQYLSSVYRDTDQYAEGLALSEQAVRLHRETGNLRGEGLALGDMSMSTNNSGNFAQALILGEQALSLLRRAGDVRGEGIYTGTHAATLMNLHREEEAAQHYARSIVIHRQVGNSRGLSADLTNYGLLLYRQAKLGEALARLEEALQIRQEMGDAKLLGTIQMHRAGVLLKLGRGAQAVETARDSVRYTRQAGSRQGQALSHLRLMLCLLGVGRSDEARDAWVELDALLDGGLAAEANKSFVTDMQRACTAAGIEPFSVPPQV